MSAVCVIPNCGKRAPAGEAFCATHSGNPPSIYLNVLAERAAVLALGKDIGFGRVIQLAHQCWDEMLEAKHGIKNHSEGWTLASADIIRERRATTASPLGGPTGVWMTQNPKDTSND